MTSLGLVAAPIATSTARRRLSVVAPCFNEEAVLPEFFRRTNAACARLGISYEIVLVNDGSRDRTWAMMKELADQHSEVVAINLSRNHGHQLALTAGLSVCQGDRVLIIDADLQDPPELLPEMLRMVDEGCDVVYGQRRQRAGETAFKKVTAAAFYRILDYFTDVPIPRDAGDFRLMTRRSLDALLAMPERHRFVRGMVSWLGFRQAPIVYDRDPRFAGETKYPFRRMLRLAVDAITSFSVKPLALATITGLVAGGFSFVLFVYALVSWAIFQTAAGWTSLMAGISLIASVQFLILGIFGEYLGRLYEQGKGRPLFIIQEIVQRETAAPPIPHSYRQAV